MGWLGEKTKIGERMKTKKEIQINFEKPIRVCVFHWKGSGLILKHYHPTRSSLDRLSFISVPPGYTCSFVYTDHPVVFIN